MRMDWVDLLGSPRDSQGSSPTPQFKSVNSSVLSFLHSPLSHPYMTTGKTIALLVIDILRLFVMQWYVLVAD